MSRLEYRLASALLRLVRLVAAPAPDASRPGRAGHRPGVRPSTATCSTSIGRCARATRSSTSSSCSSRTATAWRASSPTSSGWSAACTTSRRPACSSSTTPTCRSTSPRTGRPRRSSRSGMRPARSSGSGSTRATPLAEPERTFLHRYYDAVVVGGEWTRGPYAAALRTPVERVRRARLAADRLLLRRGRARRRTGPGAGRLPGARRPARRPLRPDVPRSRGRQAGRARPRCGAPAGGAAGRPRARPQDAPEPRSGGDPDRRLRRRRRPGRRDQRAAGRDRHPDHRLFVVGRRVRAARAGRSSCWSATSPTTRSTPGSTSTTGPR